MKKLALIAFLAAAAATIYAASSQVASAPPGKDNIAFGYGAGYNSTGNNTNVLCIGTDAGANSANNTDCIFIGKNAGAGVSDANNVILIGWRGSAPISSNAGSLGIFGNIEASCERISGSSELNYYTRIKGGLGIFTGNDEVDFYGTGNHRGHIYVSDYEFAIRNDTCPIFTLTSLDGSGGIQCEANDLYVCANHVASDIVMHGFGNLEIRADTDGSNGKNGDVYIHSDQNYDSRVSIESVSSVELKSAEIVLDGDVKTKGKNCWVAFDGGQLCVYTNGVKAGSLTFTPVAH